MDTKKTLRYNWEFGRETVAIRVSSYRNNGNLYVAHQGGYGYGVGFGMGQGF